MNGATILMIEDDPQIMGNNRELLELEGYRVLEADTLERGKELMEEENPNLILLDILLPDGNGLEYCRELRGDSTVRILFISALSKRNDVVEGILAGGDGYITKPYTNRELLAYVKMLLRRAEQEANTALTKETTLSMEGLKINPASRRALLNGADILLKPMEYVILEYLVRHRDEHITAEELYEKLWGMDTVGDVRTVWEHVSRIRNKLGDNSPIDIESKRGKGYRIVIK